MSDSQGSQSGYDATARNIAVYSRIARFFHWVTALAVVLMLASGFYMTYRGKDLEIWDGTTNFFYTSHKLLGFALLWLVVARLAYRLTAGAPGHKPSLAAWQRVASALNHWGLYLLLLAMPILGWWSVSLFPALNIFGWFDLPAIAAPDREFYKDISTYHGLGGRLLLALVALHLLAVIYHVVILKDGVLRRMLPKREDR